MGTGIGEAGDGASLSPRVRKDEERRPEVVARACATIIGRDDSSCGSIQPFHALTYSDNRFEGIVFDGSYPV